MTSRVVRQMPRRIVVAATLAAILALSLAVWAGSNAAPPAGEGEEPETASSGDTVRIYLQTVPARRALVKWGRKSLGFIPAPRPLLIERQRDSGPLDLVIRASGYLPVHTRVYTFSNSRVSVRLTPPEEKSRLFGYRQEPTVNPDGGAPAEPAAPPSPQPASPAPLSPP